MVGSSVISASNNIQSGTLTTSGRALGSSTCKSHWTRTLLLIAHLPITLSLRTPLPELYVLAVPKDLYVVVPSFQLFINYDVEFGIFLGQRLLRTLMIVSFSL